MSQILVSTVPCSLCGESALRLWQKALCWIQEHRTLYLEKQSASQRLSSGLKALSIHMENQQILVAELG